MWLLLFRRGVIGKVPAFPLYASDFDMDTATWETDEVGAYLRLLLYEWVNGSLPDDTYKLSKIVRESERKFREKWKNLSQKFTLNGNGLLVNKRMEKVREEKSQFIESQREKGIKSAKKRWGERITPVITMVEPVLQPDCNPSSSSSKKEKIIKNIYGEFQNVKLTEEEHQKLKSAFGEEGTQDRVESLSQYIASKGKKYSSHYATILSWEKKHEKEHHGNATRGKFLESADMFMKITGGYDEPEGSEKVSGLLIESKGVSSGAKS